MSELVDLSHTIRHGTVTYPGLPEPEVSDHLTRDEAEAHYAPGVRFHIGRIDMVANTGTYLDSPWHRWEEGADLSALPIDSVADLPGVVVDVSERMRAGGAAIDADDFAAAAVAGRAGRGRAGAGGSAYSSNP